MLIREWRLDNSVNIERPSQCTNRHSDSSNIIDHLRVNIICERDACGRMRRRVRELGLELELVVHSWSWCSIVWACVLELEGMGTGTK
jgi:hypothetical protein